MKLTKISSEKGIEIIGYQCNYCPDRSQGDLVPRNWITYNSEHICWDCLKEEYVRLRLNNNELIVMLTAIARTVNDKVSDIQKMNIKL